MLAGIVPMPLDTLIILVVMLAIYRFFLGRFIGLGIWHMRQSISLA